MLGYDFDTTEFAVKDGIPYAIDFFEPRTGRRSIIRATRKL